MKSKRVKRKSKTLNGDNDLPQIGVRLPLDQVRALDARAANTGGRLNRSDLIRQAIDKFLKES